MPLTHCPGCGCALKIPDTAGGKQVRCPRCEARFTAPPAEEVLTAEAVPDEPRRDEGVSASPTRRTLPEAVPAEARRRRPLSPEPDPLTRRSKSRTGLWLGLGLGLAALVVVGGAALGITLLLFRARTIPDSEWMAFNPPGGDYSVLMPGTPARNNTALAGLNGDKYVLERRKEDAVFAVAHIDLPPGNVRPNSLAVLAAAERDQMLNRLSGKVVSEGDVTLAGRPGREFHIDAPGKGMFIERVYLTTNGPSTRVYVVAVGGRHIQPGTGDAARFLDSFRFLRPAQPLAGRPPDPGPKLPVDKPKPPDKPRPPEQPKPPPAPPSHFQPGPKVDAFFTAAVDTPGKTAFVLSDTPLLKVYSYPDFKIKGTYSIGGVAYRSALDTKQGRLYLAISDPKQIRNPYPNQRTLGTGDVHVYDVKGIVEGRTEPGTRLKPLASVRLGASLGRLLLSPDGRWLYYLDLKDPKNVKAGRIDTKTFEKSPEMKLADKTEVLCLRPDGKALYSAVGTGERRGRVQVLDPAGWKVAKDFDIDINPFDLDATDSGTLFITHAHYGSGDLVALDVKRASAVARWPGLPDKLFIRLSPDRKYLYLAYSGGSPQFLRARTVPERPSEQAPKQVAEYAAPGVLGGSDMLLTSDNQFLLLRTGQVLKLVRSP